MELMTSKNQDSLTQFGKGDFFSLGYYRLMARINPGDDTLDILFEIQETAERQRQREEAERQRARERERIRLDGIEDRIRRRNASRVFRMRDRILSGVRMREPITWEDEEAVDLRNNIRQRHRELQEELRRQELEEIQNRDIDEEFNQEHSIPQRFRPNIRQQDFSES